MVQIRKKLKRCIPLLLALVVLISCLPAIPVAAAESMTLSGVWKINSGWEQDVESSHLSDFSFVCDAYIIHSGASVPITKIFFDSIEPDFIGCNYSAGTVDRIFFSNGYNSTDDGFIYFNQRVTLTDADAIFFFTNYAVQVKYTLTFDLAGGAWSDGSSGVSATGTWGDSISNIDVPIKDGYTFSGWTLSGPGEYSGEDNEFTFGAGDATLTANWIASGGASTGYATYVTIDGHTYVFKGNDPTSSSPSVTMDLSVSSIDFSWKRGEHSISVPSNFLGLSTSEGGEITYLEGSSYTLPGGIGVNRYFTFYSVVQTFSSKITIGGQTYTFSGDNAKPEVLLSVNATGAVLSAGSTTYTYTYSGEGTFHGLSYTSDGSLIEFPIGKNTILDSGTTMLYPIASSGTDYVSVITIGDKQFSFTSATELPAVTLIVTEWGARMQFSGTERLFTYTGEGSFQGLSFSPTGSALFVPGQSYELVAGDHTLYPISSASDVINTGLWRVKLDSAGSSVALSAWPSSLSSVNFDFRSDTNDWTGFSYADGTLNYLVGSAVVDAYVYSSSAWTLEEFKTVYLASDQLVDAAFAAWFTTNFERIGDDPDEPVYTTTINVYNNDGSQLLGSFSAEGLSESPNLLLTVRPDGLKVDGPDGLTWSWDASGLRLAGFSYSSSSSAADLSVYFSTAVGKKSANVVRDLYVVEGDIGTEQAQGVLSGFISFLITPLQAFFAIEFIPGLSFGKIAMFAFLLGLVFWFFKASK